MTTEKFKYVFAKYVFALLQGQKFVAQSCRLKSNLVKDINQLLTQYFTVS